MRRHSHKRERKPFVSSVFCHALIAPGVTLCTKDMKGNLNDLIAHRHYVFCTQTIFYNAPTPECSHNVVSKADCDDPGPKQEDDMCEQ